MAVTSYTNFPIAVPVQVTPNGCQEGAGLTAWDDCPHHFCAVATFTLCGSLDFKLTVSVTFHMNAAGTLVSPDWSSNNFSRTHKFYLLTSSMRGGQNSDAVSSVLANRVIRSC